ncbi:unnamed protein product [Kuraishia capsulata CBS 1993]|uniref:Uncharacterized protein n=1 Tax=Kuraishia capsulata CBS 1993 TaxID=1382522 RepID=W6MW34_9ASCO|nr:uncharacterized protein KUCA_T00002819001 [Kuraishia capsulata CBS 1993]CDK26845.1 unnamed protein product [Kuraishia capsulata CBS 1993]
MPSKSCTGSNKADALMLRSQELFHLTCHIQPSKGLLSPVLIVEGVRSSGKTFTLNELRKIVSAQSKWIDLDCRRVYGIRGILQRFLVRILNAELQAILNEYDPALAQQIKDRIELCDGISSFIWTLEVLLEVGSKYFDCYSHIFVLDHIDQMLGNDSPVVLATALARLHEQVPKCDNFCFVFVASSPNSLDLTSLSLPHVFFPAYTYDQLNKVLYLRLMASGWRTKVEESLWKSQDLAKDTGIFFKTLSSLLLESFSFYIGSDVDLAIHAFDRLFPHFVEPIARVGSIVNGVNDPTAVYNANRKLLQSEWAIRDTFVDEGINLENEDTNENRSVESYDITLKAKYIIIAAYLASFTDSRYDLMLFSKTNEVRANSKLHRKIRSNKFSVNSKMLQPQPFPLERLLAILHAIYHEDVPEDDVNSDVLLLTQLNTLASLKLILRATTGDSLTTSLRWKCNVNWTVAKKFADDVGFEIQNYFIE